MAQAGLGVGEDGGRLGAAVGDFGEAYPGVVVVEEVVGGFFEDRRGEGGRAGAEVGDGVSGGHGDILFVQLRRELGIGTREGVSRMLEVWDNDSGVSVEKMPDLAGLERFDSSRLLYIILVPLAKNIVLYSALLYANSFGLKERCE